MVMNPTVFKFDSVETRVFTTQTAFSVGQLYFYLYILITLLLSIVLHFLHLSAVYLYASMHLSVIYELLYARYSAAPGWSAIYRK